MTSDFDWTHDGSQESRSLVPKKSQGERRCWKRIGSVNRALMGARATGFDCAAFGFGIFWGWALSSHAFEAGLSNL
jgi:hypothetical protein